MKDLAIYRDTKRNEKCPCGSGKIFKKCCMKEYREARKKGISLAPIQFEPLTIEEKKSFEELYRDVLIFTSLYKEELGKDDENIGMTEQLMKDRSFFYENREEILEKYKEEKVLFKKDKEILDIIKNARFEKFIVSRYSNEYAIIIDKRDAIYFIEAIDLPFGYSFRHKQDEYAYVQTALLEYKHTYIPDGIFEHFAISINEKIKEDLKKKLDKEFARLMNLRST